MAKSIFERISSIFDGSWPEMAYIKTPDEYAGMTGVEKYLTKQAEKEQQEAEAKITGVEKYLAKQAKIAEDAEPKAGSELTGVAKYLQQQSDADVASDKEESGEATGVAKYLSKQKAPKKASGSKKSKTKSSKKNKQKEGKSKKKKSKSSKGGQQIDLTADADRCQASTSKGSQCKRSNSLVSIQRIIDKQKYKFMVCSQHKSEDFIPFSKLLS